MCIITLEGIEEINTEKMTTKHSDELAAYIVQLFDSHFLLVYSHGLKYILARKMYHNVQQSDNNTIQLTSTATFLLRLSVP